MKIIYLKSNKSKFFFFGAVLIGGVFSLWFLGRNSFEIFNSGNSKNAATGNIVGSAAEPAAREEKTILKGSLSGLDCENKNRRPFAAMLAGDPQTRPLSGISEADVVVEMPVTPSINRLMAVYQCGEPKEIGSVRSSRDDFIPLAAGFGAVYAHWGGSHFALDKLNRGIIDNIDALKNPHNAFYRKEGIPAPDNGFTSDGRLVNVAKKLGYRMESEFEGYWRLADKSTGGKKSVLEINYSGTYAVKYEYYPNTNVYLRFRGGKPEIDKNSNAQVSAKNVVVMKTVIRPLEDQYNDVDVDGEGAAIIYRNGEEIKGKWKKDAKNLASKLYFYDGAGEEIAFAPGSLWIEIVSPETEIRWGN